MSSPPGAAAPARGQARSPARRRRPARRRGAAASARSRPRPAAVRRVGAAMSRCRRPRPPRRGGVRVGPRSPARPRSRAASSSALGGRIGLQAALGEIGRTDRERRRPADVVRRRAHDQLRGAAADIDDAELAGGRVPEGPRRAEERQPGLLLTGEDGDRRCRTPGRSPRRATGRSPPGGSRRSRTPASRRPRGPARSCS